MSSTWGKNVGFSKALCIKCKTPWDFNADLLLTPTFLIKILSSMNPGFSYVVQKVSPATLRSNVTHSQVFQKQAQEGKAIAVTLGSEGVIAK